MIVRDFHVQRVALLEAETYAPLVVDAHAPLSGSVAFQCFQLIARWGAHIVDDLCQIKLLQLAQCCTLKIYETGNTLTLNALQYRGIGTI